MKMGSKDPIFMPCETRQLGYNCLHGKPIREQRKPMKFSLRPHAKDPSKALNPEPKPEKPPLIVNYDRDGVRIGDDGYPMTPVRSRMHHTFNAMFIWGIVCALGGAACAIIAYAQGQQFGGFEGDFATFDIETYGGNMINGHSVATILRIESIVLMASAVLSVIINIQGFRWFYDRKPATMCGTLMGILAIASIAWQVAFISMTGFPDPATLVTLVLLVLLVAFMRQVVIERPSLKKAKIARTEVKK